jgi:small multidrug resistance family-3 protein
MNALRGIPLLVLLLIATLLEVGGDAVVRMAIVQHAGIVRWALFLGGALLLLGYGSFLNLAPLEFRNVVGIYVAIFFIVWQGLNFVFFRSSPTLPVLVGGAMIVAGGLVVSFWKTS